MEKLSDYLSKPTSDIDMQWLNDKKPVQTHDGRNVSIDRIDYSVIPNQIIGKIKYDNGNVGYFKWSETGKCLLAHDKIGNPYKPSENDLLMKLK